MQVVQFGQITLKQFTKACEASSGKGVRLRDNQTGEEFVADSFLKLKTTNDPVVFTKNKTILDDLTTDEGQRFRDSDPIIKSRVPDSWLEDKKLVSKSYETRAITGTGLYVALLESLEESDALDDGKIARFLSRKQDPFLQIKELDIVG